MLKIGLTGGIGAGKSAVAARLAEHGAVVIDADLLAREVVAPGTAGLRKIEAAFGPGVLAPDGTLDRPALGARVFGDDAARRRLEGIIHPLVRARTEELSAAAPSDAIVVNDVPLLVEAGLAPTYHLVIVVEAPEQVRVDRLVRTRGMSAAEARARIGAQATDDLRRTVADVLLPNEGSLEALHARVDALWERLRRYDDNLRAGRPAEAVPGDGGAVLRDGGASGVVPDGGDGPDAAAFARLAARIRHAAGGLVADIAPTGNRATSAETGLGIELTVARPDDAARLAPLLAAAGFPAGAPQPGVARPGGRWHGSADPGQPAWIRVRVAGTPAPIG